MLRSVRVPAAFEPPFARAESLYLSWFDALSDSFGEEAAREFIYKRSGLRKK